MTLVKLLLGCGLGMIVSAQENASASKVWEVIGPDSVRQAIRLDSSRFSPATFRKLHAEAVQANNRAFTQISFHPEGERVPYTWHNISSHRTYNSFRSMYLGDRNQRRLAAEAISTPSGAVLRMSERDGQVSREILEGSDPLMISSGPLTGEILHIEFRCTYETYQREIASERGVALRLESSTITLTGAADESAQIFVRLRTWPDSKGALRLFTEAVAATTGLTNFSASYRADPWLFGDNYPIVNPFVPQAEPPSVEEWEKAPSRLCYFRKRKAECLEQRAR
ncbi:MAG: hypothetical protein U0Q16_26345 [Bryobacteraceae bacterium]